MSPTTPLSAAELHAQSLRPSAEVNYLREENARLKFEKQRMRNKFDHLRRLIIQNIASNKESWVPILSEIDEELRGGE